MVSETIPQLKTLSLAKKRRLIAELVDEVFGEPVRERALAGALAARVVHYHRHPGSAKNWAKVKARLRRRQSRPKAVDKPAQGKRGTSAALGN